MTDTPRTKQLKEVRQKRLAFLEKKADTSNGEPVSKSGIKSSRTEKTVRKPVVDERFENSGLKDAAGKSSFNKPKTGKNSGDLEGFSGPGRSSLVSGSRSSHDFKSSNDFGINKSENNIQRIGLVEKCVKKTPRDVNLPVSGRKSTNDLRLLNDISLKRAPKENGVDSVEETKSLGRSVALNGQAVSSDTVRKASSSSQTEKDKRRSYDVSQDQSTNALNDEQPGTSWHLNSNSISDSISSKKSAKQGFDTYRIARKDLPEKSGVTQEPDLVALSPVNSHRLSLKPSISQSKCFGSSEVVKMKATTDANCTDAKNALPANFTDEKRQQTDHLGCKDVSGKAANCSVPLENGMPLNSVALEDDDLHKLFKSCTFQDLRTGNSIGKTSSVGISSDNGKPVEALTHSKKLSKSSSKSSVSIQVDHNGNSRDKGVLSDPRRSDTFSSSASSSTIKSVAGDSHVDDAVKVSEENDETMVKRLTETVHPSRNQAQKTADLDLPPSESVEYLVPDFVKDIPKVNAVQRSQIPFGESNDFVSSFYVGSNSEVRASETLVSTLASTLNFGSVNLELVLGKDRMERLLKNIMEIDGSSDFTLKESTVTDSYDVPQKLEDKPQVIKDSSTFDFRDSRDTDNLGCVFNGAQASCESLGLKTHRPDDHNDASQTLLNSSSSSSIRAKKEKLKCSFLVDEIYAEAQMLKDGQGCRSRSDFAMATVPDALTEVTNKPEVFVDDQNGCDFKGTHAKLVSKEVNKVKGLCSNAENGCTRESLQAEPKGIIDSKEKKKRQRRETQKRDALADSREEHIKGIRLKMQQQGNQERGRPEGIVEDNSEQVTCYMNPAIDRYFKSMENLSFDKESLLPKTPLEKSPKDGLELSAVGRSLQKDDTGVAEAGDEFQQKLRDMKQDLFQAIDHNNDALFSKITSSVDVVEKDEGIQRDVSSTDHTLESSLEDGRQQLKAGKRNKETRSLSSPPESQIRNTITNVSSQDLPLSTSEKVKKEEKLLNRNHGDDTKASGKMQSSNAVSSSCTTTSVWKIDSTSDEKNPGMSELSSSSLSCGMKEMDKKPVFAPILNVRDSEEFEYSDLGRRGMGSFGEFFKDEVSINLRDSGDGNAVGRSRNSSVCPQSQLKSIVEDCAMDSVNFDYIKENKLDFSEELKATLRLNLDDSLDAEQEQRRLGKKGTPDVKEMKEDKSQEKKSSKADPLRKSVSVSQERQQEDAVRSVPQKLKQEESVSASKSSKTQHSDSASAEDAEDAAAKNDDFYRDFVHHLVSDARFKKTGLESKSSENLSVPPVPKLQLNTESLPVKSVSRSLAKTAKVSSSKSRPFASLSMVLGKAKVAWKEDDLVMDVSASVRAVPLSRQRPWSAKVLPRSSFPDDSASVRAAPLSRRPWSAKVLPQSSFQDDLGVAFDHSLIAPELLRPFGEAASIRRKRPSSVGPKSIRKLTSSDADLGRSIEDFGGRHSQEQRRPPSAQSVQINKAKGQSKQVFRFATEDYEKYSALSPRIQAGELSMLTSFPDEILLKIFSYLPRSNLSRCARVCQHFFRVAMDNSLWKCIEVEEQAMTDEHLAAIGRKMPSSLALLQCTGDKVTSNGLRQLFWECSESLRELRFSGCSKGHLTGENILLHATNRCRNITHLDGSWTNLSSQGIIAFSEESERLVSVCLNGCQSINDEAVQTLVARHGEHLVTLELLGLFGLTNVAVETIGNCCKSLVTLTLGQCWKLTDGCLAQLSIKMPLLENLDLRGCKQIKDQTIHQLVKNCGQLTSLSLANCPNLTDSSLAEIAVQCPRLRSLDVCGCTKLTNVGLKTLVSGCSLLKYLDLSSTSINHRSVTAIASYCSRRLEVLKLNFCKQMNTECLVRLVKNCQRLKKLFVYGVKGLHSVQELKMINPNIWIEM